MKEDWDNLLILDACRYDAFVARNSINGRLESRVSRGSTSTEFIDKNFVGRTFHDTVYVTANPYVSRIEPGVFHAVLTLLNEWDSEIQTVLPEDVVERAIEAHQSYPNKRLIIHFMQPHQPYLGQKGKEIRSKMMKEVDVIGWKGEPQEGVKPLRAPTVDNIGISSQDVEEAYLENLDIVLNHVEELNEHLDGKSVISSDHGELIGDRIFPFTQPMYGHPEGFWLPKLRRVPWFIVESQSRRRITTQRTEKFEQVDTSQLDEKLAALGYK